jgi:endonuclease/exonuclease/phosphatase family metal-dependent hydrolase
MKIISWNILANEFIAPRSYSMIPSSLLCMRSMRLQRIMDLLVLEDADVMLLQEVMLSEYNALYKQFGKTHHVLRSNNIVWQNKPTHSGNVTLLRKTMFSLARDSSSCGHITFGLVVNCFYKNKPMSFAPMSFAPMSFVNLHLDDLSATTRKKQIKEIEPLLITSQHPIVLGGDFNENYSHHAPSHLYKIFKSFGLTISNNEPTYFIDRKMCIDNIMLKGFNKKPSTRVINDFGKDVLQHFVNYGSDHLPVVVIT